MSVQKGFVWASALVMASFWVAGCGGSSNGGTIVPPPGGTTRSRPTIVLGNQGTVQTTYITGQNRTTRGPNQVASVNTVRYQNRSGENIPSGDQISLSEVRLALDQYTLNTLTYNVPFSSESVRAYTIHPLELARMYEKQPDGSLVPLTASNQIAYQPPVPFDVDLKVFPGRISNLSIKLDDLTASYSDIERRVIFNTDRFISRNYNPITRSITSVFSDYVSFDISNLSAADRPIMANSGNEADRVYFSGDGIAMSEGMGQNSLFELLDPVAIQSGTVTEGPFIGPIGQQIQGSNVFVLDDEDPTTSAVTAIVGTWKNYSAVIRPTASITAVAFPSSRASVSTTDQEEQQFVIFSTSGNQITALWQGQVFYNVGGDPSRGTFRLFPIATIDDAIPTGQVSGTVTNLTKNAEGQVMGGDWDVVGSTASGWTFGQQGGFAVFRR